MWFPLLDWPAVAWSETLCGPPTTNSAVHGSYYNTGAANLKSI